VRSLPGSPPGLPGRGEGGGTGGDLSIRSLWFLSDPFGLDLCDDFWVLRGRDFSFGIFCGKIVPGFQSTEVSHTILPGGGPNVRE